MKKKVLLSAVVTIALCLCLIAGSTFALFTSKSETNIAVTAGNVDVTASVKNFMLYSVEANDNGTIIDENGGKYVYADRTDKGTFTNGGTAALDSAGSVITLDKVTPGDKIAFGIEATNNSDVAIQCRYIVRCVGDEALMKGLIVYINGDAYPVLKSYTSAWIEIGVGKSITDNGNIKIEVELPVTAGNEYENKKTEINVLVEAVQGNANIGENNGPTIEFLANTNATAAPNAASLQDAIDNAAAGEKENIIVINGDITEDITVTAKPGVNTTIYGNGYKFAGALTIDGKSETIASAGLTIKDFVFTADTIDEDACIRLGDGTDATRYCCNVTVENCTFDIPGKAGVKSYTGGDKNISIINCTATDRAHSLVQLASVDGVLIDGCKAYSKNGINLNSSTNVVIKDSEIDVKGYAVRLGAGTASDSAAETYKIDNCTLKSANEDGDATIVLRGTAAHSTLTVVDTTVVATNGDKIANTATNAKVVGSF